MKVTWKSPSNIALVKYWGKHGDQLPNNPSVSFTLDQCFSQTSIQIQPKTEKSKEILLKFYFDGKENISFRLRILKFIETCSKEFKWLRDYEITINSTNSFPHSAGIASSASALSSLSLCLVSLDNQLRSVKGNDESSKKKASMWARIGSGSACRSIYGKAAVWGKTSSVKGSSNLFAVPIEMHSIFNSFRDTILIAASTEKKVSSRIGHSLMEKNVYAEARYKQAVNHMKKLIPALKNGDLDTFINITEQEALTLHALMMASNPGYILMNSNTLQIIEKVKLFREKTKLPLCFTLDAGPNIHLLYPSKIQSKVRNFIKDELIEFCENGRFINDKVGNGPSFSK